MSDGLGSLEWLSLADRKLPEMFETIQLILALERVMVEVV